MTHEIINIMLVVVLTCGALTLGCILGVFGWVFYSFLESRNFEDNTDV